MKKFLLIIILVCIIGRLVVSPLPINEDLTTASDQGGYLHLSWFLKEHPGENWDSFWYAGFPSLRFYPPAVFYLQSVLAGLMSDILAFKLVLSLVFALTPLAFYYLLKEFRLTLKEKAVALVIFSFMFFFNNMLYSGKAAVLLAVLTGLVFFRYFIRSVKAPAPADLALSGVFLGITILTHSMTSIMYVCLSALYLLSIVYLKFDWQKVKRSCLVYVSGPMLSAFWLIPFLAERGYALPSIYSELESSLLNLSPFTMALRTFGTNVNLFTIAITGVAIALICFGFYREYRKRKNAESLFLVLSSFTFIAGHFVLFYVIGNMSFSPENAIVLWPIFLSILIAKAADKKIVTYLAAALIILQLVLFFGVPMQAYSTSEYTKIDASLKFLEGDGRVSVQPRYAPYTLATINDYRVALYGKENEFSTFPETLSEARYDYIYSNYGFDCVAKQSASERILSTDFLERHYIKVGRCELETENLEDYFSSMYVRYVIVNKEFPEVEAYFSENSAYARIRDDAFFSVYELLNEPQYAQSDQDIGYSYYKLQDKIVINMHSDSKIDNVMVRISEGWYPFWASTDAEISQDMNGFMVLRLDELDGSKTVELEFKPPEYYNLLPLISFFWLAVLSLSIKFDFFRISR